MGAEKPVALGRQSWRNLGKARWCRGRKISSRFLACLNFAFGQYFGRVIRNHLVDWWMYTMRMTLNEARDLVYPYESHRRLFGYKTQSSPLVLGVVERKEESAAECRLDLWCLIAQLDVERSPNERQLRMIC